MIFIQIFLIIIIFILIFINFHGKKLQLNGLLAQPNICILLSSQYIYNNEKLSATQYICCIL